MRVEGVMELGGARCSIPVLESASDEEIRRLAWFGFQDLIASSDTPPESFTFTTE